MKAKTWQQKSSKVVYENSWIKVRHDEIITPGGKAGVYGVVEKKDFVLVIPKLDDKFIMIEQFRYPIQRRSWEFPEGSIEPNEEPIAAAARELEEETGYRPTDLKFLGQLHVGNALTTQSFHVFFTDNLTAGQQQLEDTEADFEIKEFTFDQIKEMIKNGILKDSPTVSALALYIMEI